MLDKDPPPARQRHHEHQQLAAQLARVGLELRATPEGFYAIRVKPTPPPVPRRRRPRRRRPRR